MRLATCLGLLAAAATSAYAQVPPQYTQYNGPSTPVTSTPKRTSTSPAGSTQTCGYWLDEIKHQGVAAFNPDATYKVFRNVKDYGAKDMFLALTHSARDGVTDDTAAINNAISSGGRAGPLAGQSSTTTLAVVYFPPGTYLISSPIVDYYYTQIIGNPNCMPTILASPTFHGGFLLDGDQYGANGQLDFGATNVFYRQVRNLAFDLTQIPASAAVTAVHWPTAQATSLQNLVILMSDAPGTQHEGVLCESGSGGFMTDLVFRGGAIGMGLANQQFTMRNMSFTNTATAIAQYFDWGWTYKGFSFNNCSIAINMTSGGSADQSVGSVILVDSAITNTPIGVLTAWSRTSQPPAAGQLILENVQTNNVPRIVQSTSGGTYLAGSAGAVAVPAYAQGHAYTPNGPQVNQGPITPNTRPGSLVTANGAFYSQSKPQYQTLPVSSFVSARSNGATGNGVSDDTAALQRTILIAAYSQKVAFIDAGTYRVTKSIYIPAGSRIVGEGFSSIMSSGPFFADMNNPQPMLRVGYPGEFGRVEMSDLILSTQSTSTAGQAGAILMEYNLASPASTPSGLWDVHARISGFTGSNQQVQQCPTTPATKTPPAPVKPNCITAFLTMHVTRSASGLYMENNWLWTADHDLDTPGSTQITVYTGRGLLVESALGTLWLYGTAVEHHGLYQYQFAGTQNIFMGQIQTETAYYQPNPNARNGPFPSVAALGDPTFPATDFTNATGYAIPNDDGWGLRIVSSKGMLVYGAGLYSFFDNYSTTCSNQGNGEVCQSRIFQVTGGSQVQLYDLHTVGTNQMINLNGQDIASYADNIAGFTDNINVFRTG